MSDLSVTKASALEKLNVGNLFKENFGKIYFSKLVRMFVY